MWSKSKILQIIYLNFIFIYILGLVRFQFLSSKEAIGESPHLLIFDLGLTTLLIILFSLILGSFAKNYSRKKSKDYLLRFMGLFYIYAMMSINPYLGGPLLLFAPSSDAEIPMFLILIKLALSVLIIFLPAYISYKFSFIIKNLDYMIKKSFPYVTIVILLITIFSLGSLIFIVNPACATVPLTSEGFQDFCYVPLIIITKNSEYYDLCDSDRCMTALAKAKNDPSICNDAIYMSGLLRHYEKTCITQFFNEKDEYNVCYEFKNHGQEFVDDCIDTYVGRSLPRHGLEESNPDTYRKLIFHLRGICHNISYDSDSYCKTIDVDYFYMDRPERTRNETLKLLKKYKGILNDNAAFYAALFNPPDFDFCRLLRIFAPPAEHVSDVPMDVENYNYAEWMPNEDDKYSMVCFANFGQKKATKPEDCNPYNVDLSINLAWSDSSVMLVCNAGRVLAEPGRLTENQIAHTKGLSVISMGLAISDEVKLGLTTLNKEFGFNESTGALPDRTIAQSYSGFVRSLEGGIQVSESLKPVNFCDGVKQFKKECKEIVGT